MIAFFKMVLHIAGYGFVLLATGLILFDAIVSLGAAQLMMRDLGTFWHEISPLTLVNLQAFIQRYTFPVIWDYIFSPFLFLPAWAVIGGLGVLFVWCFRNRSGVHSF